ncbi:Splicing factor U2AF 65 kDa subunit [Gracilariopsis chorda]|uniref:Splicing factor U2AF 65 kDa subunit n=1 Tax=Gracilariopsis chorda TaxID=448386 RepID=A0A2V3IDX6_9FLOR|nr:Splicing factor U2AF 65 kDa subunit [Gracilariopsis chorda]|eukprot:PXF40228.1 Splicing factor U2AF 65 kDa subunit [Gracilariopsis chorda]
MHAASPPRSSARARRPSSPYESDRKRARTDRLSPEAIPRTRPSDRNWERDPYDPHRSPYGKHSYSHRPKYENGLQNGSPYASRPTPMMHVPLPNTSKSRRLYIGNVPYQVGLTDIAFTQFFSALYIAAFGPNKPGEPLPVLSFWLHADGKFGFMELRGEQEAVNMMQFNGVFLHGRPLRVNRPSDYRPEVHNPSGLNLVPESVNVSAVMELCEKLGGIVAAPAQLAAIAACQPARTSSRTASPPSKAEQNLSTNKSEDVAVPRSEDNFKPATDRNTIDPRARPLREARDMRSEDMTHRPSHKSPTDRGDSNARDRPGGNVSKAKDEADVAYTVISLQNLVTDEDLKGNEEDYEDLVADVQAECENYGSVVEVNIPKRGQWKRTAFIQFSISSDAKKAVEALKKRVFDKRKIVALGLADYQTASEAAARPGTGSGEMQD